MERLSDGAIAIINQLHTERLDYNSEYCPLIDAVSRLAAYEDTRLTPEEVTALCEMDKRSRMTKMLRWEEAETDGRLILLPCKLGDTVWYIAPWSEICKAKVTHIDLNIYTNPRLWMTITYFSELTGEHDYRNRIDLILGKTVFLTRDEAATALTGQKGADDETDTV